MIKLEKVNKYYYRHKKNEIHVIDNTSLTLGNNGLVSLLGPSGCGKTTLLNIIGGLDRASKGKIYINGERISKRRSAKIDKIRNLNIGYIFQDYYLIDSMSVFDNIALVLKINGIKNKEEIKKRVNYVLEKVNMYRYRNRYAGMLSGGERQRVGIARAIVKDPSIIIADEPTGNLDSKNTIEVMNIIKAISKNRLVILVTHERELAEFYASRILEIEDGKIINDRKNEHTNELDYRMDNKIYLKEFKNQETLKKDNVIINYYNNTSDNIEINLVVQNGNIYIESKSKEKMEIVDDNSSIELVNDHYKKISKSIYEEYDFDFDKIINKDIKKRYTSIFNPITLLINGFKKVRDYSFLKKLLLIGFFASGMFITYSISSYYGITNIKDKNFVTINKNYLTIITNKNKVSDYLEYEKDPNLNYIIPTKSEVKLGVNYDDYYQSEFYWEVIKGSLSSIDMINEKDIIIGSYPKNKDEIVIDKMTFDKLSSGGITKQVGIFSSKDIIGRKAYAYNMKPFVIVGITNLDSPSIYTYNSNFVNILQNAPKDDFFEYDMENGNTSINNDSVYDYTLFESKIKIKKGRLPKKNYEVIVNYNNKDQYKLNKKINYKVNNNKLKVVGYYITKYEIDAFLVTNNTVKYQLISNSENLSMYAKDNELVTETYKDKKMNIFSSYEYSRKEYIKSKEQSTNTSLVFCFIVLLISLVEIFLMIRSSFLSRIKEVGIYRAIGMKKKDIYKMFAGEIIAITTLASMTGVLLMTYIVYQLTFIEYLSNKFMINTKILLLVVGFVYIFNLLIGLLPVKITLRKTPASILSRSDI